MRGGKKEKGMGRCEPIPEYFFPYDLSSMYDEYKNHRGDATQREVQKQNKNKTTYYTPPSPCEPNLQKPKLTNHRPQNGSPDR